jgi:hypothetical protein
VVGGREEVGGVPLPKDHRAQRAPALLHAALCVVAQRRKHREEGGLTAKGKEGK